MWPFPRKKKDCISDCPNEKVFTALVEGLIYFLTELRTSRPELFEKIRRELER